MSMTRFWVVGGEFRSPEFDALIDGTGRIWGPFETRGDAESVWREESEQRRWSCCTRFTIVAENIAGPVIVAGAAMGAPQPTRSSMITP
jgi:hypothetical protein